MPKRARKTAEPKRYTVKRDFENDVWNVVNPDGTFYGWEETREEAADDAFRLNREMEEDERDGLIEGIVESLDGVPTAVLRTMAEMAGWTTKGG